MRSQTKLALSALLVGLVSFLFFVVLREGTEPVSGDTTTSLVTMPAYASLVERDMAWNDGRDDLVLWIPRHMAHKIIRQQGTMSLISWEGARVWVSTEYLFDVR